MTDITELKGDVRVLAQAVKSGQEETNRRLEKIEDKIDAQANVSVGVFDEFKKEVRGTYVTSDTFDPIKRLVYGTVSVVGTALIIAGIGVVLAVRQ